MALASNINNTKYNMRLRSQTQQIKSSNSFLSTNSHPQSSPIRHTSLFIPGPQPLSLINFCSSPTKTSFNQKRKRYLSVMSASK